MKLKLFTQPNCPNCPPAKELAKQLEEKGIKVERWNIDEVDGLAESAFHSVSATPALVLVNGSEEEIKKWEGSAPSADEVLKALKV